MDKAAGNDEDLDGVSDYNEWVSGTDPTNALSRFRIDSAVAQTNGLALSWNSLAGRVYSVQAATNLAGKVWGGVTNLPGIGSNQTYEAVNGPEKRQEVFKVSVDLSPDEVVNP